MAVKRGKTKSAPVLSHEFVIQNHADIVACIAMVFVVGLMFQVSSPLASVFIALHHNVSVPIAEAPAGAAPFYGAHGGEVTLYTTGIKDVPAIFFYLLIAIVMHQIIQEYLLDRINRKLHLSKIKHAKFNESGQLVSFYLISIVWAADIIWRENLFSIRLLWENYPHVNMTFMTKFFFIIQIAYWLHTFPELYFQKVKKEDMSQRIQYAVLYLLFIGGAYLLSFTRVGLCLLVLQYVVEALFHASRLLSYADRGDLARPLYKVHDILFVLARLGSISLAVLTFWYGLALAPAERQVIDIAQGSFNTFLFRLNSLVAICLLQAWLMWSFITFHLKRMREAQKSTPSSSSSSGSSKDAARAKKTQQDKAKARKEQKEKAKEKGHDDGDDNELPEVDQNTKKSLRQRK